MVQDNTHTQCTSGCVGVCCKASLAHKCTALIMVFIFVQETAFFCCDTNCVSTGRQDAYHGPSLSSPCVPVLRHRHYEDNMLPDTAHTMASFSAVLALAAAFSASMASLSLSCSSTADTAASLFRALWLSKRDRRSVRDACCLLRCCSVASSCCSSA